MKNKDFADKEVWISCRSVRPCGGNKAKIVFVKNVASGGRAIRYKCLTCGKKFHVVS